MRNLFDKKYLEIYYFLLSFFFFLSTKNTWAFRKISQSKDVVFEFSFMKYLLVSCFVLMTINYLKKQSLDTFSENILGLILILDFIPSSIFFVSTNDSYWSIYFFHIFLFYSLLTTLKLKLDINLATLKKKQVLYFLLIVTFLGVLPYLRYVRYLDLNNLILKDVYVTRLKFRVLFDTYSGYTHSWFTRVIIPIIFVLALKFKLRFILVLNILLLIFLYLMGAVKSVLLGSILVILFYYMPKGKILKIVTGCLILMLFFSIVIIPYVSDDLNLFGVIVFRRMMFIPQLLDYCYIDFFKGNHLYWSNSFLKGFIHYPYDMTSPRIIGEVYFEKEDMAANNGLISDGFSNGGWMGVLFTLFIFNSFMLVVKICKIDLRFFGVFFFILYGFITTAVSTVLITHGGILLLFISFFLLREKKQL